MHLAVKTGSLRSLRLSVSITPNTTNNFVAAVLNCHTASNIQLNSGKLGKILFCPSILHNIQSLSKFPLI